MNVATASSGAVPRTSITFRAGLIAVLAVAIMLTLPAIARAGSWHIVPSPNIPTGDNSLVAVDARSASNVWAVGYAGSQPLVERWNGVSWRVRAAPSGVWPLVGVEALSWTNVWVIGSRDFNEVAVYRWNGSTWKDMAHPFAYLPKAMSATSGSNVWTVTSSNVWQWNGTAWVNRTDRSPQPDGSYACVDAYPVDVTALSSSNVWVIGYSERGYSVTADHWNGSTWTCYDNVASGPACCFSPSAISGSSGGNVWIVGSNAGDPDGYFGPPHAAVPVASKWNGLRWTPHNPPAWPTDHWLYDVSAASASSVWAVGGRRNLQGTFRTLTEHWTGAGWVDLGGPNKGTGGSWLSSVSIVPGTQNNVWAVGSYGATPTSASKTLILHYY
jgi:hypothetical protein